jgi:hypothetical protein
MNFEQLDKLAEAIQRRLTGGKLRALRIFLHDLISPNNVLKIEALPRSWSDRDHRMFHAVFQLLVDFVELEQPFIDWQHHVKGRSTDAAAMRAYVESRFNSPEGLAEFHNEWDTDADRAAMDERTKKQYHIYTEILDCYEWYKNKGYELDRGALYDLTGEDLEFSGGGIKHVDNGKPKLLSWGEAFEREEEHEKLCDLMLERVIRVRRHLWT